jgi:hypothetical protein
MGLGISVIEQQDKESRDMITIACLTFSRLLEASAPPARFPLHPSLHLYFA